MGTSYNSSCSQTEQLKISLQLHILDDVVIILTVLVKTVLCKTEEVMLDTKHFSENLKLCIENL